MSFFGQSTNLLAMCNTEKNRSKSDFGIHNECGFVTCREENCSDVVIEKQRRYNGTYIQTLCGASAA